MKREGAQDNESKLFPSMCCKMYPIELRESQQGFISETLYRLALGLITGRYFEEWAINTHDVVLIKPLRITKCLLMPNTRIDL